MPPAYFVCVCGLCGTGVSVSGASNISYILYNYLNVALDENKHFTYLYWWNIVWFTGENTISNHGTLITPSGSGPVSRDISSYPIKETVKPPGDFSFRQLSGVLQEWRRAIFIRFPSGSHPMPSTGPAI